VVFVFVPAFFGAIIGPLVSDATFTRSAAVAGLIGFGLMLVWCLVYEVIMALARIGARDAVPVEYEEDADAAADA
jgi:flagellar biosynthesis/type III secretory pathway M-ring protein FliF/YscJ